MAKISFFESTVFTIINYHFNENSVDNSCTTVQLTRSQDLCRVPIILHAIRNKKPTGPLET